MDRTSSTRRLIALVSAVFGVTALLLTVIGMHGVVSRRVADRRQELALRAILGASPLHLQWIAARPELAALATGLAAGAVAAWSLSRFIEPLVYSVQDRQPAVYLAAASMVVVPAAVAVLLSTRSVIREDLAGILRGN
jgi:hypothetical protein